MGISEYYFYGDVINIDIPLSSPFQMKRESSWWPLSKLYFAIRNPNIDCTGKLFCNAIHMSLTNGFEMLKFALHCMTSRKQCNDRS